MIFIPQVFTQVLKYFKYPRCVMIYCTDFAGDIL